MLNRNTAYVGTALNDPVSTSLTLFVTTRDEEQGTNNLGKRYCFLPNMCLWVIYNTRVLKMKIFSERNKKPDLCRYLMCFSSFEKLLNDILNDIL